MCNVMNHVQPETQVWIEWQRSDVRLTGVLHIETPQCKWVIFMPSKDEAWKVFAAVRDMVDGYAQEASGNPIPIPRHERRVVAGGALIV